MVKPLRFRRLWWMKKKCWEWFWSLFCILSYDGNGPKPRTPRVKPLSLQLPLPGPYLFPIPHQSNSRVLQELVGTTLIIDHNNIIIGCPAITKWDDMGEELESKYLPSNYLDILLHEFVITCNVIEDNRVMICFKWWHSSGPLDLVTMSKLCNGQDNVPYRDVITNKTS